MPCGVCRDDNKPVQDSPPRLTRRSGVRRGKTTVLPSASWEAMQTRIPRTNLKHTLRVNNDGDDVACNANQTDRWFRTRHDMCAKKLTRAFGQPNHWCVVADANTHSYGMVMPSNLYGPETDMAGFLQFQGISRAKPGVFLRSPTSGNKSLRLRRR